MNETFITQSIQSKIKVIVIFSCFFSILNGIQQKCNQPTQLAKMENNNLIQNQCPQNSVCNNQGYCSCMKGFYGNCQYKANYLNIDSGLQWIITQNNTYFIVIPQIEQTTVFYFAIITRQIGLARNSIIYNLWIDNGYIIGPTPQTALINQEQIYVSQNYAKMIKLTLQKQPNGEFQNVILSFRLKDPGNFTIKLTVGLYSWNTLLIIGLVFGLIIFICTGYGIYLFGKHFIQKYRFSLRRRQINEAMINISIQNRKKLQIIKKVYDLRQIQGQVLNRVCTICLMRLDGDILMTDCNHYFDKDCLQLWYENNGSCPNCRANIQRVKLIQGKKVKDLQSQYQKQNKKGQYRQNMIDSQNSLNEKLV